MKVSEAPEMIYLQDSMSTDTVGELWPEWFNTKVSDNSIEYTRTDAFIEKAVEWWMDNFVYTDDVDIKYNTIQSFKNYMKGE